jgi:hypothetical protein
MDVELSEDEQRLLLGGLKSVPTKRRFASCGDCSGSSPATTGSRRSIHSPDIGMHAWPSVRDVP